MKSFQSLKEHFNLEKQDFYRYLQLRGYYNSEIKQTNREEHNLLIKLFINAYRSELSRGTVAQLYKYICNLNNLSTNYFFKEKWTREGASAITNGTIYVYPNGGAQNLIHGRNFVGKMYFAVLYLHCRARIIQEAQPNAGELVVAKRLTVNIFFGDVLR